VPVYEQQWRSDLDNTSTQTRVSGHSLEHDRRAAHMVWHFSWTARAAIERVSRGGKRVGPERRGDVRMEQKGTDAVIQRP
jgi:hypothetical protein